MTALVDDLLLLARSDSGAITLNRMPVDLGDVAAEGAGALTKLAADRGVSLGLDPEPAMVRGDHARLRQLIVILVDNAVRHTPRGGSVLVRVRCDRREVTLDVDDDGPGIRPEDMPGLRAVLAGAGAGRPAGRGSGSRSRSRSSTSTRAGSRSRTDPRVARGSRSGCRPPSRRPPRRPRPARSSPPTVPLEDPSDRGARAHHSQDSLSEIGRRCRTCAVHPANRPERRCTTRRTLRLRTGPPDARRASDPTRFPAAFDGRTPGRARRSGPASSSGAALVVALGTAVVMAASTSPPTPAVRRGSPPSPPRRGQGRTGDRRTERPPTTIKDRLKDVGKGRQGRDSSAAAGSARSPSPGSPDRTSRSRPPTAGRGRSPVTSDTKITKGGEPATIGRHEGRRQRPDRPEEERRRDVHRHRLAIILPQAAGTVTAVDASTVTIKVRKGANQAINTNGSTKYHLGGSDGTRADVKVGSRVVGDRRAGTNGNLTARASRSSCRGSAEPSRPSAATRSRSRDRKGTKLTVHVAPTPRSASFGVDKATVADVKAGMVDRRPGPAAHGRLARCDLDRRRSRPARQGRRARRQGRSRPSAPDRQTG